MCWDEEDPRRTGYSSRSSKTPIHCFVVIRCIFTFDRAYTNLMAMRYDCLIDKVRDSITTSKTTEQLLPVLTRTAVARGKFGAWVRVQSHVWRIITRHTAQVELECDETSLTRCLDAKKRCTWLTPGQAARRLSSVRLTYNRVYFSSSQPIYNAYVYRVRTDSEHAASLNAQRPS